MAKIKTWDLLVDLSLIGQTFELNKKAYKFTRYMYRAKKNPVVAVRANDGTAHRFGARRVAAAFWHKNNEVAS